jgi:LPXTG-motif cell wall-anchored protein
MFHFRRKKSIALLLTVCFLLTMVAPGFAAGTEPGADSCTVGVAIVDVKEGNLIFGSKNVKVQSSNDYDMTALGALDAAGVPYETQHYSGMGHMVTSINELANEGMDGWMYTVNDEHATRSADAYEIKEGDHIVWYYATIGSSHPQWDSLQIPDSMTFDSSSITLEKDETKQVTAVLSYVNGETKDVTDEAEWAVEDSSIASVEKGLITALKAGTTTVSAAVDGITAQLLVKVNPSGSTVTVNIAIIDKDRELINQPGEVTVRESGEWGLTAFGALDATGIDYEVDESEYGPFLTSVNGQAGDKNGGWMYTVNDESPLVGMHQYDIQDGDCIIVYNSTDWENPAPTWEELTGQTPPNSDPDPEPEPGKGTNIAASKALSELISYYKNNKTALNSWAEVVALRSAGVDLTDGSWQLPDWEIDELNEDSYATDYAGTIIGMLAVGQEPTDVDGRDLVQELVDRQNSDGSFGDWFNETIWSMIALDTAKAEYDVSAAVKYLCDQQLEDGGFALFGTDSDPDTTGMVLIALAPHKDIEGVPAVINDAIECLKGLQQESGGFASWGEESAESAAAVIRGLVAVGVDPDTMAKNGNTVFAALMSYQLADKSFSHIIGGESDSMATSQALTAIGDMVNGNVFDRIRDSYAPGQFDPYPGSDPDTTPPGDLQDPDETTPAGDQQDENKEKTTLPKTGGENLPIYLAGAALLCAGALMVRRKQLNQK